VIRVIICYEYICICALLFQSPLQPLHVCSGQTACGDDSQAPLDNSSQHWSDEYIANTADRLALYLRSTRGRAPDPLFPSNNVFDSKICKSQHAVMPWRRLGIRGPDVPFRCLRKHEPSSSSSLDLTRRRQRCVPWSRLCVHASRSAQPWLKRLRKPCRACFSCILLGSWTCASRDYKVS
jgi:hypothetical protein